MVEIKDKKRVGILRGGQGDFYESSVAKGGKIIAHVIEYLSDKYKVIDIFIDKEGLWHSNGMPILPADLMHRVDIIWNVSHPSFSKILDDLSIPNIGVGSFTSIFQDRKKLEKHVKEIEINMPRHLILPIYQEDFDGPKEEYAAKKAKEVHERFGAPWIVKSMGENSNAGIHVAETFPELILAIQDVLNQKESILVEELISGKNAFMYAVSDFRGPARNASHSDAGGDDVYVFPAVGKYSKEEKEKLNNLSKKLHKHLGEPKYLKSNFVLHPKKGIFLTGVEFHPDLEKDSHFHKTCKSVGAEIHHVVDHLIESNL